MFKYEPAEMTVFALICAIFLANRVKAAQININSLYPTNVNTLAEASTEAIFALQIRQIRSTLEATPAASAGNNLNVVGASDSLNAQTENFQAISTIYSAANKEASNKKHDDEGNVKLRSPFEKNVKENEEENSFEHFQKESVKDSQPLVWDSCSETTFSDDQKYIEQAQIVKGSEDRDVPIRNLKQDSNIWTKRNVNNSASMKAWLEKYNTLRNNKTEKIHKQEHDSVLLRKLTEPSIATNTSSTMQIVPITKHIFIDPSDSLNWTQDLTTENNIRAGYTGDSYKAKDRPKIRFTGLPQTDNYLIPTLKLEEGFHPFGFMAEFFSLIYPFEFPVGLIKDIVWGKFTFPYSFLQTIKVESTFLGFIIVFTCISLVIPSYLIILGILALLSRSSCNDEVEAGALFPEAEKSGCKDRVLVMAMVFVILLCCILISGMAISNEQACAAAAESRNAVNCACADLASWLAAAARDLHHSLVAPIDLVLQAYREDLRNVDTLLGLPIQQAIASESGIDLVLDSMADIIAETEDLSSKISSLRDMCIRAGALASSTSDRLKDLVRQLGNMKKYCSVKDMPLCDTINTQSLELKIKFDLILKEQQLLELRSLGSENLTRAISNARQEFRSLPSAISTQTAQVRADIMKDIETRGQEIHASSRVLTDIVRHFTGGLHSAARQLDSGLERVQKYEFWRWTVMLACIVTFAVVMVLILAAMLCGCGNAKSHAKRTLQTSSVWLSFTSLILWGLISASFLIAGHAEVYVCHALWDSPKYETLSALLDRPSPLLPNNEGVFDALFRELENTTIDVSVKDVLRECEMDRPAYVVFQLDKVMDVDKETSYFEWTDLQEDLSRLTSSVDVGFLKTVSSFFNKLLNEIIVVSDVNLASYRMNYNGPIVGKDLPSLAEQLENVAAQISDLTTAGRFGTLATRTQRLHTMNIKPLEQLRADAVFKLTELELQLAPFRRKLNISLSHMHTAQFYIDNQGDVISHKKVSVYASRLVSHASGWRGHVLAAAESRSARCGPLFAVFKALRALLCDRYVASLHGWWVCGFFLGILWCTALTPLCVKLWRAYDRRTRSHETMSLDNLSEGQQGTPTTALCESSNWNTPGPPPPRNDSW